ncbi:DUF7010 family protein [Hymenobacter koreensis]|uniref:Uncharacterized protein n=1 Tax=Hymenobacter koreensis TaxID=1084523 RepID=A0ABP8IZ83_9BACT
MVTQQDFDALRLELSVKAKNGVDFITAASLLWASIAGIWALPYSVSQKALFTFIVGGLMLPLALLLSKLFKTTWTVKSNPLQPLGLWLNFAQLFYFPFLIFVYIKAPQYFIMSYGIITGAHFFPYAWFFNQKAYAVWPGLIAFGCMFIGLRVSLDHLYLIPAFVAVSLLTLAVVLFFAHQRNKASYSPVAFGLS